MEKQTRKSKPRVDLTGKQFGYLTPMFYIKGGKWHCKCQCGNELDVDTRNLNSGHTKSCGCLQKEKASNNTIDMSNYEDENLKIISRAGSDEQGTALWKCMCKHCGNYHSLNEQNITKILQENNIEFATQYTFPDLFGLNGGHLRFDFAIFNNSHELSHLIEYNGKQHYIQPDGDWSNNFETTIRHDKLKQEYCQQHNIRLIIIPYNTTYSIEDLL